MAATTGPGIPHEMREAAEAATRMARHAFDEAMTAAMQALDAFVGPAADAGLREAGRLLLEHTGEVTDDALDYVEQLMRSERPQDFAALQQQFVARQVTKASMRTKRLTDAALKAAAGLAAGGKR